MVRGSWSKPWHLNCSPCICLKAWDKKFFSVVFLWRRLQLLQISPFFSLLLLLFAISSPYLRKLLPEPLLWVPGRARAVIQLSLDFPSPPLTSQRSVRVRKPLGRGKVEANPSARVSEELWLWHKMNKPSANESRNSSWRGFTFLLTQARRLSSHGLTTLYLYWHLLTYMYQWTWSLSLGRMLFIPGVCATSYRHVGVTSMLNLIYRTGEGKE